MAKKQKSVAELEQLWKARCAAGTFSDGVQGVGTIRVMGKAGDGPRQFPRIDTLDALGLLEEDERWAVEEAKLIFDAARAANRRVLTPVEDQQGATLKTRSVLTFEPMATDLIVGALTSGG